MTDAAARRRAQCSMATHLVKQMTSRRPPGGMVPSSAIGAPAASGSSCVAPSSTPGDGTDEFTSGGEVKDGVCPPPSELQVTSVAKEVESVVATDIHLPRVTVADDPSVAAAAALPTAASAGDDGDRAASQRPLRIEDSTDTSARDPPSSTSETAAATSHWPSGAYPSSFWDYDTARRWARRVRIHSEEQ